MVKSLTMKRTLALAVAFSTFLSGCGFVSVKPDQAPAIPHASEATNLTVGLVSEGSTVGGNFMVFSPQFAGTKVPTFEEALSLAHGKIGVYVDSKEIAPRDLVAALEKTDMLDKVVIYGGAGFLKAVLELRPSLKVMPEADDVVTLGKASMKIRTFDPAAPTVLGTSSFGDGVMLAQKRPTP